MINNICTNISENWQSLINSKTVMLHSSVIKALECPDYHQCCSAMPNIKSKLKTTKQQDAIYIKNLNLQ